MVSHFKSPKLQEHIGPCQVISHSKSPSLRAFPPQGARGSLSTFSALSLQGIVGPSRVHSNFFKVPYSPASCALTSASLTRGLWGSGVQAALYIARRSATLPNVLSRLAGGCMKRCESRSAFSPCNLVRTYVILNGFGKDTFLVGVTREKFKLMWHEL